MKKLLFSLLVVLVCFGVQAQSSVSFSYSSTGQDSSVKGKEGRSSKGWGSKITSFSCRTIDAAHAQEWNDLSRSLRKDNFEEWFSVRKGKERLQLLSRESKDGITELACMIVGKEGSGLYMSLGGHFTLEDKERIKLSFQKGEYDQEISRRNDN